MNKREEARLNELLAKKQAEEKAEKAFYTKVKRQRKEVLKVLGVPEDIENYLRLASVMMETARKYGTDLNVLVEYINSDQQVSYYKKTHKSE